MPKVAKELSAKAVRDLSKPGIHSVGGVPGLALQITDTGAKSWILRIVVGNRRRNIGLGGFPGVTLAMARERAREMRDLVFQGIDPLEEKKAAKARLEAAQAQDLIFREAAKRYLRDKRESFKNPAKEGHMFESSMERYVYPFIGNMRVGEIERRHVYELLADNRFWFDKTPTASRVRARIERVLDWAKAMGYRHGDNPAAWRGGLDHTLPSPRDLHKRKKQHQPALPVEQMPEFMADLRNHYTMTARCLELCILTAVRSGEVRKARWEEFDLKKGVWTIPAERMKMDRPHRVPLPACAVEMLNEIPRGLSDLVFPGMGGKPLSENTPGLLLRRMHEAKKKQDGKGYVDAVTGRTVVMHGFRSTFRDWAGERTSYPRNIIETALAHLVGDETERAYARGDLFEKRRQLMKSWADYCAGTGVQGNVTPIRTKEG